MKYLEIPGADELKKLFRYDSETGFLFRLRNENMSKAWNTRYADKVAHCVGTKGHLEVSLLGRVYKAHRFVWVMHNGPIPNDLFIDHINGKRGDNRIENLRLATNSQNLCNQKIRKTNTSGVKGVNWDKVYSKWKATIQVGGVRRHLGYFEKLEDAADARKKASNELQGEYAFQGSE